MTPKLIVDLFAGPRPGGWDEGARLAGYTGEIVGLEWDMPACRTAVAAGHARVRADVATYPTVPFVGKVGGLIASPPCQAWSKAGRGGGLKDQPAIFDHLARISRAGQWIDYSRDGWHDPRSPLVLEVVRWIDALRPQWFSLEQVEEVLPFWREVCRWAETLGYATWAATVNSEQYGVAQTRRRAAATGVLGGPRAIPEPTHQRYQPGIPAAAASDLFGGELNPWISMADALGWGLPDRPAWTVTAGGTEQGGAEVFGNAKCRDRLRKVVAETWPFERPATTVLGDPRIGRPGHKDRDKGEAQFEKGSIRVTVQDAARLQSFRDDYPWAGTVSQQHEQVGNAVPPLLAAAILRPLLATSGEVAA